MDELPNINKRIKILIETYSGGNVAEFVKLSGISSHQVLNRIFNKDSRSGKYPNPSGHILTCIQIAFPDVNPNWLLNGEGKMLKKDSNDNNNINYHEVPMLPISAKAGRLSDFIVSVKETDCEKIIVPIKNVDMAMNISGDSMAPEYPNGCRILLKKIKETDFIEWGRDYVLDTTNGPVFKRLTQGSSGSVKCISLNESSIYAPFEVPYSEIFGIYRVLFSMSDK